jgi:hypothetical protein
MAMSFKNQIKHGEDKEKKRFSMSRDATIKHD